MPRFYRKTEIALLALFLPAYGGSAVVCARCHPKETAGYLQSSMGASLGPPVSLAGGSVTHQRSGSVLSIEHRGGKMVHRLSERGLTAEYTIGYQIGAGRIAHSYLVEVNGYLFESPATWFKLGGWDVSPGYAAAPAVDFDRPITETCLFCHADAAKFSGGDRRRVALATVTAISCERCHGSSESHIRRPSATNIVNPAKLPNRARDSVCEQCHLEGEARVLNPGKNWKDFRPGENFERIAAVYVLNQENREVKAVSQIEQLAQSKCASGSDGKLWCGTCHNPHGQTSDRNREIRGVCASCHSQLSREAHSNVREDCTHCHMPRVATEHVHVAVTDHRIVRNPARPVAGVKVRPMALSAWVEPPAEVRQRDRLLASLIAVRGRLQPMAGFSQPQEFEYDPAALAALCDALLGQGRILEAVPLCRQALEKLPDSADRAMNLGIALARSGDLVEAERQLRNAIGLDPSLKHAYIELWTLYDKQGRIREMNGVVDQYLTWNPRNIMFRVLKAAIEMESILTGMSSVLLLH